MWILKKVGMVLTAILTSFYFFPFEFSFLPGVNTKMTMAGFGLVLLAFRLARKQESRIDWDFFKLSLWAGAVCFIGLIAVGWEDTHDNTDAPDRG